MNLDAIHTAVTLLSQGKLVALPTETVYGLGGDARNLEAIHKIFRVKNRPPSNPLIIHLPHISAMQHFARAIPDAGFALADAFWPGPLTLVLPKHPSVLPEITGGQDSVALRIPNHPVALALLKMFEGGIAAPSANRSGGISPTAAEHVIQGLGSAVDYVLDGGPCHVGIESTIVSLLEERPVILRPGQITEQEIADVLGYKTLARAPKKHIETPGSSLKHYAPSKPLWLLERAELQETLLQHITHKTGFPAVLCFSSLQEEIVWLLQQEQNQTVIDLPWIQLPAEPGLYAQGLYAALHNLDASPATCILVEMPPRNSNWSAVLDRLQRAAL